MKRIALVLVLALVAASAVSASARRSLPARGTLLGGGTITTGFNPNGGYGLGFVTLAVAKKDGRTVRFYGDLNGNCNGLNGPVTATFNWRTAIRPDGSFSGTGPIPSSVAVGTFTYEGRFTSSGSAEGTGRVKFTYKPAGIHYDCDTGTVHWQARASLAARGRPSPQRNTPYYGTTAQTLPIVLAVSPDGRQITQAALLWNVGCQRNKLGIGRGTVSPAMPVRRDGRFGATSSYTDESIQPGVTAKVTSIRNGRFGAHAVAGTWRIKIVLRKRGSNQLLDVCDSGVIRWTAAL